VPTSYPRPELLASTDWLAENLGRPGVRVVDCRWRPDGSADALVASGHIQRASWIDWTSLLDAGGEADTPRQLAAPDAFAAAASQAGIGDGTVAVLYDDSAALYATRVWWSLRAYGYTSSRVLDGGYPRWKASGMPVASGVAGSPSATVFSPRADLRARVSAADVRATLSDPSVEIVDARSPAEFRGEEGPALRLGHIPGARNVPAVLLTVPGVGEFQPADALGRLLGDAGLQRGRRVIVYDATGVAAAKVAFALALLGYDDVALYEGGWAEWGDRTDLPVER
jgi:thiosulfate/3-mercaptopyruvate sulfurtransferase